MVKGFENSDSAGKTSSSGDNSGEAFRHGEWLCHFAPKDIVGHGADGTTVTIAKKGRTICDEYSSQVLDLPPIFQNEKPNAF